MENGKEKNDTRLCRTRKGIQKENQYFFYKIAVHIGDKYNEETDRISG